MNIQFLRHVAYCSGENCCRTAQCAARHIVRCISCGKILGDDREYIGYFACLKAYQEMPKLENFRRSQHMNHIPVCLECFELIKTPDSIIYKEDEFRKAMDEFKRKIGLK